MSAHTASNLAKFYGRSLGAITPGQYTFVLTLLRAGYPPLDITAATSELDWTDEGMVMGATATIQQPDTGAIWIARGHQLRLTVHWTTTAPHASLRSPHGHPQHAHPRHHTWELWTMRCKPPQNENGRVLTVEASDNMEALRRAVLHWHFPRRKGSHPHGWTADEIARAVCRRLGVKVGKLMKGKTLLHGSMVAGGLHVITWAYEEDRKKTGAMPIFRMVNGAFQATQIQRNPMLYVFGEQIASATSVPRGEAFPVTVIDGYGYHGNGASLKKLHHVEFDHAIVKQIGYRPATVRFGRCEGGMPELIAKCKRRLAADLRLVNTATITVPGIPFILRGEGVMLRLPRQGYAGSKAFVYTSAVHNSISGGTHTTELQLTAIDPFASKKQLELLYNTTSKLAEAGGIAQIGPGEE